MKLLISLDRLFVHIANSKLLSREPVVEIANNAKTGLRIPTALLQQSRRIEVDIEIQRALVQALTQLGPGAVLIPPPLHQRALRRG
jgi:hypothetical protein